ncbi:MAG TPA: efflux RND transporter permease subunit, partial [Isosphaeraceae bacterium]|nr:efflux RND transporter permease subunit [Isosphaeraceae bacterium]
LEEAAKFAPRLRAEIARTPEVRGVMSHIGRPDDGTDVTSYYNLEFNVPLHSLDRWRRVPNLVRLGPIRLPFGSRAMSREEIQTELSERFQKFSGVNFNFSQLIRDNVEEALSGVKGANSVKIFGNNLDRLEEAGAQVVAILKTVRGVADVGLFHIIGQPNLEITIDRDACARYGLNVADVETVVQVAVGGRAFSQMVEGEKIYEIVLRLPLVDRDDPEIVGRIPIDVPGESGRPGIRVPLKQVAEIVAHRTGASCIYRENNRRYIPVKFSVRDRDLASAIAEAQARVTDPETGVKLPGHGYRIDWSGEFAQMKSANARLLWIVPISVGLILALLYTAFSNLKDTLLVTVNIVAATMGGIWALRFTGTPFSISAAVGFISIFGVAVQDGVLLISYFNQMRFAGLPVREAVLRGAELRVRPVIMTSLTAALGLLPAALSTSIGSQAQRPLAIVVIGGMLVTLLLTRYLMPVLYSLLPASTGPSCPVHEAIGESRFTDEILGREPSDRNQN